MPPARTSKPNDVDPSHYKEMMESIPRGFVLVGHKRRDKWREFTFKLKGKNKTLEEYGFKRGDHFVTACVRKD